jgi:sigma-B regulation protein RsbU (phosphoserine phosphatase)
MLPSLLYLLFAVIGWLGYRASHGSTPLAVPDALRQRVLFDAIGILVGLGSRLVTFFAGTEGLVSMRMQTELALAHGIQETLVPAISFQSTSFEIYGKSIPSAEMGGDLIDVVQSDGTLLAYVADISGHGLAAGQLMGMLKTAMRLAVQFREEPVAMLESTDCVLAALSEPAMFATLALLHFDSRGQAEFASAGHVPILHYRDHSRDAVQLRLEQLPLGLIPGRAYTTEIVSYSARNVFLMVTDGITEVVNERDEEFGLTRLEEVLIQNANRPLPEIGDSIMGEVKRHGVQQDDQSLLLVRARDMAAPGEC